MYGDVSALYAFPALWAENPVPKVGDKRMNNIDDAVALFCDCIMLNTMYDIFLVGDIYLAIEEAHAMGTYWH